MQRIVFLVSVLMCVTTVKADEKLAGIACRSVHLGYQASPGTAFSVTTVVRQSAEGTYFCAIGFSGGYFGLQQLAADRQPNKTVIFSVWDPTEGDDQTKVPANQRVQLRYKDPAVRVGRFGGEGTGGQSFFDYDWKLGAPYRFLVSAAIDPQDAERTAYTGYFFMPETSTWKKLITFSTLAKNKNLSGYYSFVEDFRRNRVSTTRERRAEFGAVFVRERDGRWQPVGQARFTADSNPATNIDAGVTKNGQDFFLVTGGTITNQTVPLRGLISLQQKSIQPAVPWPSELR